MGIPLIYIKEHKDKRKSKTQSRNNKTNALQIEYSIERMGFYETNLRNCTQC
jgi:hypothetical protein